MATTPNTPNHIAMCLNAPSLDRGVQIRQQVEHFESLAASEQLQSQSSSPSPAPSPSSPMLLLPSTTYSPPSCSLRRIIFTGDGRTSLKERWSRIREDRRRQSHGYTISRPSAPVPAPACTTPSASASSSSGGPAPVRPPRSPRTPRTPAPMDAIPEDPGAPRKERASRPIPIPKPRATTTRAGGDEHDTGELMIGMSFEGVESIPHLIEMVERAADEWAPSI